MKERLKKAVAAIVYDKNSGRVLVGKKKADSKGSLSGKYHLPGETLEPGESDKEALIRGMKEEAGIKIKVIRYLASSTTPKNTKVKWYECEPLSCEISFGSDLSEVLWVPRKEVIHICDSESITLWPKKIKEYFLLNSPKKS